MESNLNIEIKDYNGPLDVLLELVHKNKYDLKNLPILDLCNQYIAFIEDLKKVSIEIASEYLLMASIMVFLKSKFSQLLISKNIINFFKFPINFLKLLSGKAYFDKNIKNNTRIHKYFKKSNLNTEKLLNKKLHEKYYN